jgi:hypothetical protein
VMYFTKWRIDEITLKNHILPEFWLSLLRNICSLATSTKLTKINWLKNVEFMVKVLEGWNLACTPRYQLVLDGFFLLKWSFLWVWVWARCWAILTYFARVFRLSK